VATARAEQEERDHAALARYEQARTAAAQVLKLLQSTPWDRSDLARIRAVLDELDQELIDQERERQRRSARVVGQRDGAGLVGDHWRPNSSGALARTCTTVSARAGGTGPSTSARLGAAHEQPSRAVRPSLLPALEGKFICDRK
jgi:hypothetical protein